MISEWEIASINNKHYLKEQAMMHGNINQGAVSVSEMWGKQKPGGNTWETFPGRIGKSRNVYGKFPQSFYFFCFAWAF